MFFTAIATIVLFYTIFFVSVNKLNKSVAVQQR